MIKSIPATWDETRVLPPSDIGELAVFARRTGPTWFLAILNGPTARKVEIPLSFLPNGDRNALIVRDEAADPTAVKVEQTKQRQSDRIQLDLSPGGGYIARFARDN